MEECSSNISRPTTWLLLSVNSSSPSSRSPPSFTLKGNHKQIEEAASSNGSNQQFLRLDTSVKCTEF